jgi:hydroxymethylpyrimidine/phosphomethylpyrimidine kinase
VTRSVLLIAGLDPTGGAGLLADAAVCVAHGLRPVGVATALTVQDTAGVRSVNPAPAEIVGEQLRALLADVEVAAVKIGMLGGEALCAEVADALSLSAAPVVWDPVLAPSAGAGALYAGDPRRALALLAPHVTLATPNLAEAAALSGAPVAGVDAMVEAGRALRALGLEAVLVKGGHLPDAPAIDVLCTAAGEQKLRGERIATGGDVHGTGCALATAIACALAAGQPLDEAAAAGKRFVAARLASPVQSGRGAPSVM